MMTDKKSADLHDVIVKISALFIWLRNQFEFSLVF